MAPVVTSYHPHEPLYWDEENLGLEINRIFDICHSCRLCFNLCPSFPALFDFVDSHEDEVAGMTAPEKREVIDLCYNCKICYLKCPYVPPHDFLLDFPQLVLRARAQRVKKEGVPFRDRLLARSEMMGTLGSLTAPLANWSLTFKPQRELMHHLVGIHRNKLLPRFHTQTFDRWWRKHVTRRLPLPQGTAVGQETPKVALFTTCSVNYNAPQIGTAAVQVLEHNDVQVAVPHQRCCGMPFIDQGDVESAQALARENVASLLPLVRAGHKVVVLNPTCSLMMKQEYPRLLHTEEAAEVAKATQDVAEYLMNRKAVGGLKTDFGVPKEKREVTYHQPCHLQMQNIGYKSRDLLQLLPKTRVKLVTHCSGHDGTWAMKKEFFEKSLEAGKKLFAEVRATPEGQPVCSDCALASVQIEQGTGRTSCHPIEMVWDAYQDGAKNPPVPVGEGKREP